MVGFWPNNDEAQWSSNQTAFGVAHPRRRVINYVILRPLTTTVGRCRSTPGSPQVARVWFLRLNLKYDE
jgi:hypothetical protein